MPSERPVELLHRVGHVSHVVPVPEVGPDAVGEGLHLSGHLDDAGAVQPGREEGGELRAEGADLGRRGDIARGGRLMACKRG